LRKVVRAEDAWKAIQDAGQQVLNEVARDIHENLYTNTKSGNRRVMFSVVRRVAAKMGLEVPIILDEGRDDPSAL
jgi:hypothetical protein